MRFRIPTEMRHGRDCDRWLARAAAALPPGDTHGNAPVGPAGNDVGFGGGGVARACRSETWDDVATGRTIFAHEANDIGAEPARTRNTRTQQAHAEGKPPHQGGETYQWAVRACTGVNAQELWLRTVVGATTGRPDKGFKTKRVCTSEVV